MSVRRFIRKNLLRIATGAILAALAYVAIGFYARYQREQRIASDIRAAGGVVALRYWGPDWLPTSLQTSIHVFDRVWKVELNGCDVSQKLLLELPFLTDNEAIDLSGTQINDAELSQLRHTSSLWRLELGGTRVTDAALNYLSRNADLRWLDLSRTQVNGTGFEQLQPMTKLRRLILRKTQVTNARLQQVASLKTLGWLDLRDTTITDAGLVHLKQLTSLRELLLEDTQTTAEGRAELRSALPFCEITPR